MPLIAPSDASLIAALISSFVASVDKLHTKSVQDPSGVGTLSAIPSSFPLSAGITFPTAFAAPVDVGTIFAAADLPLL